MSQIKFCMEKSLLCLGAHRKFLPQSVWVSNKLICLGGDQRCIVMQKRHDVHCGNVQNQCFSNYAFNAIALVENRRCQSVHPMEVKSHATVFFHGESASLPGIICTCAMTDMHCR